MPFTEEQKLRITQLYEPCNHNAAEIARAFCKEFGFTISRTTVLACLKEGGYETNSKGGRRERLDLPESSLENSLRSTTSHKHSTKSFKVHPYANQLTRYWKQSSTR